MSRLLSFPEPPITEKELRHAYASLQMALVAQTQARLAVKRLCNRAERGAPLPECDDLQLIPELQTIWRRVSTAKDVKIQPG